MRACDGAVVLVDAVEGMMPQTETVLRQAIKELVKPVLFINKVDRLIKELKLSAEKIQERFIKIISKVNQFIDSLLPEEFKGKWKVSVEDGSVAFGSAKDRWAISVPVMKETGISFAKIIEYYEQGKHEELAKLLPLHRTVLSMVVKHLPNPVEAQQYRIKKIWHGDLDSETGQALLKCDPNGPVVFVPTKIVVDRHAGEIAGGRLFSGTVKKGQEVLLIGAKKKEKIQQVSIYKGAQRIVVDEVPAGNMVGIVGLHDIYAGETVSTEEIEPFESLKHLFEPVVTVSIEAKNPADLPKLIEVLRQVAKEDPTVHVTINEETGQHLLSGMGELHLEVIVNRINKEKGVQVISSKPIVVYRETVQRASGVAEGRSPNKHNVFYLQVEPLEEAVYEAIMRNEIPEKKIKKKDEALFKQLTALGVSNEEAKQYKEIYKGCVFLDKTRGIVHIGEVIEMVMQAFEQIVDAGILAREPCTRLKVSLIDCKLHEDAIHRGPAQVIPACRDALHEAIKQAQPCLWEPIQVIEIEAPAVFFGEVSSLVQSKRGMVEGVEHEEELVKLRASVPVAEMFGFSNDLRSCTEGRGIFYIVDQYFAKVPADLEQKIIKQIRQRKGLEVA